MELVVVEDNCPDGTEPAFSYVWSGTQGGCAFPDVGIVPGKRVQSKLAFGDGFVSADNC